MILGHAAITWAQYKGVTIDSFRFSRIARYAGPFNPYIEDNPTS